MQYEMTIEMRTGGRTVFNVSSREAAEAIERDIDDGKLTWITIKGSNGNTKFRVSDISRCSWRGVV